MPELVQAVQAMLFAAEAPLTAAELHAMLVQHKDAEAQAPSVAAVEDALRAAQQQVADMGLPFAIVPIAGGWQFLTRPEYAPYVRLAAQQREQKRLSRAALETLSIIAYKQPVTKAEIEFIRGVNCDYAVSRLLEKQLVEPAGRASMPGRPLLYRTTAHMLAHFGLQSADELPRLTDLKQDEETVAEQFATRVVAETDEPAGQG